MRYACIPFVTLAVACAGGDASEVRVTLRDSAGIEIVESHGTLAGLPQWRLSPEPILGIGVLEGEPAYQLDNLVKVLLVRDRIVVADGGSRELRYFDLDGRHVISVGGRGGGPGEFEAIGWLGRYGTDSLIAYDVRQRRFSIFDIEGNFVRSFVPARPVFNIAGRFADGSFVVPPSVSFTAGMARQGLTRDSAAVLRVQADGAGVDTLIRLLAGEYIVETSATYMGVRPRPFGLVTYSAVSDSLIFVGTGDAYDIAVHDRDGRLLRLIRRDLPRARVRSADIASERERRLAAITDDNQRREVERRLAETSYPDLMPAHGQLEVDDEGNLWVQDHAIDHEVPLRWTIFTPHGRAIGGVTTPARFAIDQAGADFLLGRWRDEDDVDHVRLYRLERSRSREIAGSDAP